MSVVDRCLAALNSPKGRRRRVMIAFWTIPATLLLWPISTVTFAKEEPPFVLGLSWFAITITAVDVLTTAQVHEEGGDDGDNPDGDDADEV